MNIEGIWILKPKPTSHVLAVIASLALIGSMSAGGALPDVPAANASDSRNDLAGVEKTDDSPEALRKSLRQKLIGLVADSALEIPLVRIRSDPQSREELVRSLDDAEKKGDDLPTIIRDSLELLTRFEPADDFSNRLWRTAASIEFWQTATGSGNMSRLLDGILDLCALLPNADEASFRGEGIRAFVLSRRKDFAASDETLTKLRDRAGLPKPFRVSVIIALGENAIARRDYDAAIADWALLEDFPENPLVVQSLLSAVFVDLERGKRPDAYRVLDVLREMAPSVVKASPVAAQVDKLLALSRNHAESEAFWDGSAKWWPDWLAVDQKLGAPDAGGEIVIPLIPNLTQLGAAIGRGARENDAVERAQGLRKLAHAARWEPSMLTELAAFSFSLNTVNLSAVSREYRRLTISAYELGNVKDPSVRRPLCCSAIVAYIDSQLKDKARQALREFAALPAKEDNYSQFVSRLAAILALDTGKGLQEAIEAGEDALESSNYQSNRAMGVSFLAQLYERVGREKEAISLLQRELAHPSIAKDEAAVRLLKNRLDAAQHRGERSGHLSALTKKWLEVIQLPWLDFARPRSLSDPAAGDLDQALTIGSGTLTACERIKVAVLVEEDDSQPENRQLNAALILGFYSCGFASDSATARRWARSFLDSDDLPGGVREAFLFGCASRAFTDDDADLFDDLAAHPVRKTINSREEEMVAQWWNYFAAAQAGDEDCVRLGEASLRQPLTVASRVMFTRIVSRLSARGEFEKAKRLIDGLDEVSSAMDPDNGRAALHLGLINILARDLKWRPLNEAVREIVLQRFGKNSPEPAPIVPASDDRLLSLNLPAEEATLLRLQAIRTGRFPALSYRFWEQFMKDLPRTPENLLLRASILRTVMEGAPDDVTKEEGIRMVRASLDIDSPEERRIAAELFAPLRKANDFPGAADALRLFDFYEALRTGAPMDVQAAFATMKEERSKRVACSTALGSALAVGDEPVMRFLLETLSPQELLSDWMIVYSLPAYRALGMKDETALAEQAAREAVYRLIIEFWTRGDDLAARKAYRLADLLGDQSLIPRSMGERMADSRRGEWTKLSIGGEEALFRGDWKKEAKICEEALRAFPTYYHFLFLQGRALAALEEKESALRSLRSYISIVHDEFEVREARDLIRRLSSETGEEKDAVK